MRRVHRSFFVLFFFQFYFSFFQAVVAAAPADCGGSKQMKFTHSICAANRILRMLGWCCWCASYIRWMCEAITMYVTHTAAEGYVVIERQPFTNMSWCLSVRKTFPCERMVHTILVKMLNSLSLENIYRQRTAYMHSHCLASSIFSFNFNWNYIMMSKNVAIGL